ncbi:hypothetical protein PROFUN_01828 [Planoprotostelium fungivorum]|uniref:Lariat debranching enzyme C-terminal domain-containing protein n=1 Tax=Planoprotostelium fungivorum TaxID=1890364 RepID=A0A2P6NYW7_9EUKA|nr:hypothetical protein PROFUN_01828 [Planoprotostelium fungivorum]
MSTEQMLNIAVEGCAHGELDVIYDTIRMMEAEKGIKFDLLICCGDFQAVRNYEDLDAMAVPVKYRDIKQFHQYYSGEKVAPVLTIFVGGNHEASSHLYELPYGGWVAPNIYYMGFSNVINFAGLRIGGLTGIYKKRDYQTGHYEVPPFNEGDKRSFYHVRNADVFKLQQLRENAIDIFVGHDWPKGIENYGDRESLFRYKPFLRDDPDFGNPPSMDLLLKLKPSYWFAAHMHAKFAAIVGHPSETPNPRVTKFLALSKPLPGQNFIQAISIPHDGSPKVLQYDPEWLVVVARTKHLMSSSSDRVILPQVIGYEAKEEQMREVQAKVSLSIPNNFVRTARATIETVEFTPLRQGEENPQTVEILKMIQRCIDITSASSNAPSDTPSSHDQREEPKAQARDKPTENSEEIDLDDLSSEPAAAPAQTEKAEEEPKKFKLNLPPPVNT